METLDNKRVQEIKDRFSERSVEELREILDKHDKSEWIEETFEAIRQILPEHEKEPSLSENLEQHAELSGKREDTFTVQEVRAFVGPKAGYYLKKWQAALDGTGISNGFNGAAFFLSALWLPYRKMYLITAIFFGIILLEAVLEEVVFLGILAKPEAPAALSSLFGFAAAIVCGNFGNQWYLSHTRKVITEVRSQGLPDDAHSQTLAKRGGTNIVASVGFFTLFLVATFLMLFLLELLFARG